MKTKEINNFTPAEAKEGKHIYSTACTITSRTAAAKSIITM